MLLYSICFYEYCEVAAQTRENICHKMELDLLLGEKIVAAKVEVDKSR